MNRGCHQPNHCGFQPPQNFGGRGLPPGAGRPRLPQQRHPSFPGRGQFCGPPPRGGRFPGACIPSPRLGPRNDRGRSRPPGPGSLPNQRPPGPGSSPHQRPPVPGSLPHQRPLGPGSSPRQRPPGPGSSPHQRPPGPSPHQRPPGPGSSPHQRPPGPGSSPHQRPPGPGSSPRQRPPGPGLSPHQRPNFRPQQLMQLPPGPTNQTVGFHQGQRPHWRGPPCVRPGGPRPDAGNFRFRGQVPFSGRPARPYYDGTSNMGQKRQHPGGDGDGKKQKKKKRADKPEDFNFFCETCDRGFKVEDKYKEHTDGHEACSVDDCKFVAAPKLVRLHYDLQHRTGLAKKIWNLESPDDIAKWINERKKNYPSEENVSKKKAEMEERIARGEVLEDKYFGKMRGRGRGGRGDMQTRGRNKRGRGRGKDRQQPSGQEEEQENTKPEGKAQKINQDPLAFGVTVDSDSSGDEDETGQLKVAGALNNLVDSYADSETNKNGEVEASRHQSKRGRGRKHQNQGGRGGQQEGRSHIPRKRLTLLEKLLAPDIRHERNVILQCVRHIVKNDFFGLDKDVVRMMTESSCDTVEVDEIWEPSEADDVEKEDGVGDKETVINNDIQIPPHNVQIETQLSESLTDRKDQFDGHSEKMNVDQETLVSDDSKVAIPDQEEQTV